MRKNKLFLSFFAFVALTLVACSADKNLNKNDATLDQSTANPSSNKEPADLTGKIDEETVDKGTLLAKRKFGDVFLDKELDELGVEEIKPIFRGSEWSELKLKDNVSSVNIINKVRELNYFETVDFNYVVKEQTVETGLESFDKGNPGLGFQQAYLKQVGIDKLWNYMDENSPIG